MIYKISTLKEGGNWIQKAVNPKHRGFCTPMTKATCTPKRKALAKTFKKMAKKREEGGVIDFLMPSIEAFKSGGEVSYKDGTDNKRNTPKYANAAKCGKKLVKKKVDGGGLPKGKGTIPMTHSELVKHLEKVTSKKDGGKLPDITNILSQWKK